MDDTKHDNKDGQKVKIVSVVVLLLGMLGLATSLASCGTGSTSAGGSTSPTVTLTPDNFAVNSITITAGQTVTFNDPASGSLHILCIGRDMTCTPNAAGPSALTGGHQLTINPGEQKAVTFATVGDYPITCTVHTNMNMVVHVT